MRPLIPFSQHRIAALVRVSTKQQDLRGQKQILESFYRERGWELPPKEWIKEEKTSAFRDNALQKRTGLTDLINRCEAQELKGFVAVRVARYFRNMALGRAIYERLKISKSKLIFSERPDKDIFTSEGYTWFMEELWDSEKFSINLAERVAAGKMAQARRGETLAAKPGFGAKKKDGVIKWTKDALIVREAITIFHNEEIGADAISDRLFEKYGKRFNSALVLGWIRARRYYGYVSHSKVPFGKRFTSYKQRRDARLIKAAWKPIVPRRWYLENQAKLARRARGGRGSHAANEYIFSGLLICSVCGGKLSGLITRMVGGEAPSYICQNGTKRMCSCKRECVSEASILEQIDGIVSSITLPENYKDRIEQIIRDADKSKQFAIDRDKAIQEGKRTLALEFANGRLTIEEFQQEVIELQKTIAPPARPISHAQREIEAAIALIPNIPLLWANATKSEKRLLVKQIFEAITVDVLFGIITKVEANQGIESLSISTKVDPERTPIMRVRALIKSEGKITSPEIEAITGIEMPRIKGCLRILKKMRLIHEDGKKWDKEKDGMRTIWVWSE